MTAAKIEPTRDLNEHRARRATPDKSRPLLRQSIVAH